jgi:hypothetical protein
MKNPGRKTAILKFCFLENNVANAGFEGRRTHEDTVRIYAATELYTFKSKVMVPKQSLFNVHTYNATKWLGTSVIRD